MDSGSLPRRGSIGALSTPIAIADNTADSQPPEAAPPDPDATQALSGPAGDNVTLGSSQVAGSFVAARKTRGPRPAALPLAMPSPVATTVAATAAGGASTADQAPSSPRLQATNPVAPSASSAQLGGVGFSAAAQTLRPAVGGGLARSTSAMVSPRKGSKFDSFTKTMGAAARRASAALSSVTHKTDKARPITDEQAIELLGQPDSAFYQAFAGFCADNHILNDLELLAALDLLKEGDPRWSPTTIYATFIDASGSKQVNLADELVKEARSGDFSGARAAVLEGIRRHSLPLFKKSPAAKEFFPAAYASQQALAAQPSSVDTGTMLERTVKDPEKSADLEQFMRDRGQSPAPLEFLKGLHRLNATAPAEKLEFIATLCSPAVLAQLEQAGIPKTDAMKAALSEDKSGQEIISGIPEKVLDQLRVLKSAVNGHMLTQVMPGYLARDVGDLKTE